MFLSILCFNVIHPGTVLIGPDSEMPGFYATIKALFQKEPVGLPIDYLSNDEDELMSKPANIALQDTGIDMQKRGHPRP
jgi:hypothetical protein